MEDAQNSTESARVIGRPFPKGVSGNPGGRPKGTLKDHVRQMFIDMDEEEKTAWLKEHKISGETIWKMGEGNPSNEITGKDGKDLIPDDSPRIKELTEKLNATLHRSGSEPSDGGTSSVVGTEA